MPAESTHQRPAAKATSTLAPPPEPERLPCPRCDSTNTKFCYYNNYNFSQPRHFCKSCRRYWTRGGTLRDIPVGGATRKNAKRSRILSPPPPATTTAASTASSTSPATLPSLPVAPFFSSVPALAGSFTSMLNGSAAGTGGLFGLGLGIGPGYDDVGLGPLGRAVWAFPEVGYIGGSGGGGAAGNSGGGLNAWQLEDGGDHIVAGDCFSSWPELAISTPGTGLK